MTSVKKKLEEVQIILNDFIANDIDCPRLIYKSQLDWVHTLLKVDLNLKYEGKDHLINYYCGLYHFQENHTEIAMDYLTKSAEKGNPYAMYYLGKLYQNQENYHKMKECYLKAIERSNDRAMNDLAYHYQYVEYDPVQMEDLYLKAIASGNIISMYNLAYWYIENGRYEEAKKYLLEAVQKGDEQLEKNDEIFPISHDEYYAKAMDALGTLFSYGGDNINTVKYYRKAICRGHHESVINLHEYYQSVGDIHEADTLKGKYPFFFKINENQSD